MPVSTPNGYLDFTNATPRATKVIATSNVGIGFNNPLHALDVAGSANVGALTATTLSVTNTPLATLAANIVTYDSSTGVFQDSGGLFSNKLAVVSEQPPSALSGASTTVEKHGIYKLTASTGTPQNAFDKVTGTTWTASSSYTGGSGTGVYVGSTRLATGLEQGDWIAVELPYKATLRHLILTAGDGLSTSLPQKANLYATNDTVTWTELKNWQAGETTVLVNATAPYKKYAIVTTKTIGNATLQIGQLKLFCESFSIDGGKIEMATSAVTGGETVVEQTTGHGREPAVLKKYPEVVFADGKFEYNHDSNTYTQGGYTVTCNGDQSSRHVWLAYDGVPSSRLHATGAILSSTGATDSIDPIIDVNSTTHQGVWTRLKLPKKIKVTNIIITSTGNTNNSDRRFKAGKLFGSNDLSNYYLLGTFESTSSSIDTNNFDVSTDNYYTYLTFLVDKVWDGGSLYLHGLEYYGTEETATEGDTSLDTTITSKYNTPDLTSASLYLDGLKGSTATDYSGNDVTVTENNVTWDSTEKSWTLSGAANSNVVSADLGLAGDQPHSVSAWVKADQLNGRGLFHLGTAAGEGDAASRVGFVDDSHISWGGEDHYFSNAEWHNVTYTYNGEGSDKKLYLDGRLVGSAKNEDTFGDYPPFAMTTYSQYGYTVSASTDAYATTGFYTWKAFNDVQGNEGWHAGEYNDGSSWYTTYAADAGGAVYDTANYSRSIAGIDGEWLKIEMPHKLCVDYITLKCRTSTETTQAAKDFKILGSNDDVNWDVLATHTGVTASTTGETHTVGASKGYKYLVIVVTRIQRTTASHLVIGELSYYGHRENDLVRFPDPTNVLKYPHITIDEPAKRGYIVSQSSELTPFTGGSTGYYQAYNVFDGQIDSISTKGWISMNGGNSTPLLYDSNGNPTAAAADTIVDGTTTSGEWVQLKLPHKIKLSHLRVMPPSENGTTLNRAPADGVLVGSTDGTTWTAVSSWSGASYFNLQYNTFTANIDSINSYDYLRLIVKKTGGATLTSIQELEFYGTEEDLDVVARIGDGYDGKVRNLRVFSTALSQDRVQEIFDADKDEFGLAKSSVSVYRGHLGIGTTEPKAALTVMDEVGELIQLPPGNMVADETYFEGHGKFKARGIGINDVSSYPPWEGFDDKEYTLYYTGGDGGFNNSDATYSGTLQLSNETVLGPWLILELPYRVYVSKLEYYPQISSDPSAIIHQVAEATIYARNGNGIWKEIGTMSTTPIIPNYLHHTVNTLDSSVAYDQIAFIATKRAVQSGAGITVRNLKIFGTREQGASTLHNGELTLTRNLTVPRIGPALDADDTPRRDRLVVEYNTSTNNTENGVVKDTSGRGLDGRMVNGSYYDASEKALVFDGTDDYVTTNLYGISGNFKHSASLWVYHTSTINNVAQFFTIGNNTTNNMVGFRLNGSMTSTYYFFYSSSTLAATISTVLNNWRHFVVTYDGSTQSVYQNGVLVGSGAGSGLNLPQNPELRIGYRSAGGSTEYLDGFISNFKLYDVALTADEVKRLYDMGRCDEGGHVVNFSKTRVGIGLGDGEAPTYPLDVRGQIRSRGSLVTTFTGQHMCFPSEPMEEGLVVSADKNTYVKLNGGLASGQGGITIDESLPIVSLSKTANDKTCFGVVSSVEEANTIVRTEITGGVVSDAPKVLGDNRAIVNSVGEGAIWVCDVNGPLESGDYITTSNVIGYGQKQDDDVLHSYTVAKITMDCDFTADPVPVRAIKKVETLVSVTEDVWSNLTDYNRSLVSETQYINESNVVIGVSEYSNLTTEEQGTYSQTDIVTYYRITRGSNLLDARGNLQWEDTDQTEPAYKIRYLTADGTQTDEANAVHTAAFVGCTYHCG